MTADDVLTDGNQITPQWLTNRFKQNGHLSEGEVASLETRKLPHPGVFSFEVTYSIDAPKSAPKNLIFKGLGVGEEAQFYRDIVSQMSCPPTPLCYDVRVDETTNRQYMILKDVSDTHYLAILPWWDESGKQEERKISHKHDLQTNPIDAFKTIIDEYLKFQVYGWEHPQFQDAKVFIHPDYDRVERKLPEFFDQFSEQFPKAWRHTCEKVMGSLASLFQKRWAHKRALTLVHIDFHIHNIFMPYDPLRHRPIIFDWVEFPYGLGLFALTHLVMTASMPRELRKEYEDVLIPHYHAGLLKKGIEHYSLEDCYHDYRLCVLSSFCYPLVKKIPDLLTVSMQAFEDWDCEELLSGETI